MQIKITKYRCLKSDYFGTFHAYVIFYKKIIQALVAVNRSTESLIEMVGIGLETHFHYTNNIHDTIQKSLENFIFYSDLQNKNLMLSCLIYNENRILVDINSNSNNNNRKKLIKLLKNVQLSKCRNFLYTLKCMTKCNCCFPVAKKKI